MCLTLTESPASEAADVPPHGRAHPYQLVSLEPVIGRPHLRVSPSGSFASAVEATR